MLRFNRNGLLTPDGPLLSDIVELKKVFVDDMIGSTTRSVNFDRYVRYSESLKKTLGLDALKQWVNGSFVTQKFNPTDIDIVSFIDSSVIKLHREELRAFTPEQCWETYGVDAYIVEVHSEEQQKQFTQADILYWADLFSSTRRNRKGERSRKGFLEILY